MTRLQVGSPCFSKTLLVAIWRNYLMRLIFSAPLCSSCSTNNNGIVVCQVACGKCHSYSGHLYQRLGPTLGTWDGLTMKSDFCEEVVEKCDGQFGLSDLDYADGKDYCETHVGGNTDQFWSFPYTEREYELFISHARKRRIMTEDSPSCPLQYFSLEPHPISR